MVQYNPMSENTPENRKKGGFPSVEHQFKPGVSGNPGGRPRNPLKDYVRSKLAKMSEEDKEKFLKDIGKDLQWKMAEGNPDNTIYDEGNTAPPTPEEINEARRYIAWRNSTASKEE